MIHAFPTVLVTLYQKSSHSLWSTTLFPIRTFTIHLKIVVFGWALTSNLPSSSLETSSNLATFLTTYRSCWNVLNPNPSLCFRSIFWCWFNSIFVHVLIEGYFGDFALENNSRLYRVYYQPWRPILQFVRLIIWEREREREYRICGSLLYSIIIFVSKIEKLYLASRERRMYFKHRNIYVFAFVLHFDLCSYLIGRLKALSAQSMVSVGLWVSALALIYKSSSISIFFIFFYIYQHWKCFSQVLSLWMFLILNYSYHE